MPRPRRPEARSARRPGLHLSKTVHRSPPVRSGAVWPAGRWENVALMPRYFDPSVAGIFHAEISARCARIKFADGRASGRQIDQLVEMWPCLAARAPARGVLRRGRRRLRRMVDCDATCWHTLDPQTRLITSDAGRELIDAGVFTPENIADAGSIDPCERVLRRGREHVRGSCGAPRPGRNPQPGDQRKTRTQRPLPRPARAVGDPVRASGGVRQPGTLLGSGPHRPQRRQARLHR